MPLILKFIIALASTFVIVVGASLAWPKLTMQPRPEKLTQVRSMVMETDIGKRIAETLGVTDESVVEPVNVASVAGSAVTSVVSGLEEKAKEAATREIIIQVVNKIETLAPDQQQAIRDQICK